MQVFLLYMHFYIRHHFVRLLLESPLKLWCFFCSFLAMCVYSCSLDIQPHQNCKYIFLTPPLKLKFRVSCHNMLHGWIQFLSKTIFINFCTFVITDLFAQRLSSHTVINNTKYLVSFVYVCVCFITQFKWEMSKKQCFIISVVI